MPIPLLLHGRHGGPPVVYEPFGPWIVPWRFTSLEAEYGALRRGVGLIDYSTQALVEVQGPDRADFLHRLLSHDIKALTPGRGCRAALLTQNAQILSDLLVLADTQAHWLLCDATRAAAVAERLRHYLFSEQVTITNHERRKAVLALEGPGALEALRRLLDQPLSLPQSGDHAVVPFQGDALRLIRSSVVGGEGVLCLIAADGAWPLWQALQRRAQEDGLKLAGWEALNVARIEAGRAWFGFDLSESHLLPETGLERELASETKGCYIGQEIVARVQTYGSLNKKLMGLLIDGEQTADPGDAIVRNDEELGRVTSACQSIALRRPIAMGYVKRPAYEPGTRVEIVRDETRLAALVTRLPFV